MTAPLDLEAITAEFLQMCGPHDAGVIAECRCAERDYRPVMGQLVDEVTRLRAEVARLGRERDLHEGCVESWETTADGWRSRASRAEAERDAALAELAANERTEDARLAIAEAESAALLALRRAAERWRAQFGEVAVTKFPRRDALIAAVDALPVATELDPAGDAFMTTRRFELHRDTDVSGVSGTGVVADGILWPDGSANIRWRGAMPSVVFWHSMEHAEAVHGHVGSTRFVWLDGGQP